MSTFDLSNTDVPPRQLLAHEDVFDIFPNDTSQPMLLPNCSDPVLPLNPPDTLLKLFQLISSQSPNSPFSLLCGIPVMKNQEEAHFYS